MTNQCNFHCKNFSNHKYVTLVPESFQDKLFTIFYQSEKIEQDFDFQTKSEQILTNLNTQFKYFLLTNEKDGSISVFNNSFSTFWNEIDSFSKMILIFPAISKLFSFIYRDEYKKDLHKFKIVSQALFDIVKEFRINFLKLICNIFALRNFETTSIACLNSCILYFHEIDYLHYSLFNLYKLLQIHSDDLIDIYYKYEILLNHHKDSGTLLEFYELSQKELIQPNNLDQLEYANYLDLNLEAEGGISIDFSTISNFIEGILYYGLEYIHESIKSFLTFKKQMVDIVDQLKKVNLIDEESHDICVAYFSRYVKLENFKFEMIYQINIELKSTDYKQIRTLEDDIIPKVLHDCHNYAYWNADEIGNLVREENDIYLLKKFVVAYHKNPTQNVLRIINPRLAVFLIRDYFEANIQSFFTKDFITEFENYANSTSVIKSFNNEKEDDKMLRKLFHRLPSTNKTMVLFIFEHLISISKLSKYNLITLADWYVIILIPVSTNTRVASLFYRLIDLADNCQLLIPVPLIEAISFMEEAHLIHNQLYAEMNVNDNENNQGILEMLLDYFNGSITIDDFYLTSNSIELVQTIIIKTLLYSKSMNISKSIKDQFICAFYEYINDTSGESFCNELVKIYFQIPKYQRIPISFVINHLKRVFIRVNQANYVSRLVDFFSSMLFRYENKETEMASKYLNFDLIFKKVLENLVYNLEADHLPSDFHRLTNLLVPKDHRNSIFKELEHIIDFNPSEQLKLVYSMNSRAFGQTSSNGESNVLFRVFLGNVLDISKVVEVPKIIWEPERFLNVLNVNESCKNEFFTIVMIDSTIPYNRLSSVIHWLKCNISRDNQEGETKSIYIPPNPKINKSNQQYTFLLYKQNQKQNCLIRDKFQANDLKHRAQFNLKEFEKTNKLALTAMNFFYSERYRNFSKNKSVLDLTKNLLDPNMENKRKQFLKELNFN